MKEIIVSKFGGSSMADATAIKRSATVARDRGSKVVLVSATYGTTNKLIELSKKAQIGEWNDCQRLLSEINDSHHQIARDLEATPPVIKQLDQMLMELRTLANGVMLLKECSKRAFDSIQSFGERMSSLLMTVALGHLYEADKSVECFDIRKIMRTDDNFGAAAPQLDEIKKLAAKHMPNSGVTIYVTQGFIGATEEGHTTTLGRGGSDYSAALVAEAINADVLEIWTDVAGIATTDPRICPEARPITEITFKEASELAIFGGKILHPRTLVPAMRKNIPVFVGSSMEPNKKGTWIRKAADQEPLVRAMALKKEQSLVTLTTPKMLNTYGFLASVFSIFDRFKVSIDAITTSEISVAFTIDDVNLLDKSLMRELEVLAEVKVEEGLTVVSLIGNNINYTPGLAKNIFTALNGTNPINVRMICQGASKHNFCFLVKKEEANEALQRLHKRFIEEADS